jgi:hypothetical protein
VANGGRADDDGDLLVASAQRNAMLVAVGSILATLAVIFALLALTAASRGVTTTTAVPWIITLLVCAGVLGALCVVQQRLWLRAWNLWRVDPSAMVAERFSWVVHLISYPVVVVGIFAGIAASRDVGFAGAVANWSTLALVPLSVPGTRTEPEGLLQPREAAGVSPQRRGWPRGPARPPV